MPPFFFLVTEAEREWQKEVFLIPLPFEGEGSVRGNEIMKHGFPLPPIIMAERE